MPIGRGNPESLEQARAWYHSEEYRHPMEIRKKYSTGRVFFTDGL